MNLINKLRRRRKMGFTLAEVLITLAITGVVSAMTIPIIANQYHKTTIENRLKQTNAIMAQMFRKAEGVHGFMRDWPLEQYAGKRPTDWTGYIEVSEDFVKTYMSPFLSGAKIAKDITLREFGYRDGWKYPDGTYEWTVDSKRPVLIRLANGVIIIVTMWYVTDVNGRTPDNYYAMGIVADIDGFAGKNVEGKDIFHFTIPLDTGIVGAPGKHVPLSIDREGNILEIGDYSRSELLSKCRKGDKDTRYCTALVMDNAWTFPKDYPW